MLIKEIRDKFSTAVERAYSWCIIFFVIYNLVLGTISGVGIGIILGHTLLLGFLGAVIGLLIGYVLGDLFATMVCGFSSTVIHISETNDKILSKFSESTNGTNKNLNVPVNTPSEKTEETPEANSYFSNDSSSVKLNEKPTAEKSPANNSQSNVWVCLKCGATNPVGSMLCQNCGH